MCFPVIPAEAGIQEKQALLDPGIRRGDDSDDLLRVSRINNIRAVLFIELQIFAKGVAVFCNSVQNCRIQQDSCPAFGGNIKSALADVIIGGDHDH
jgi:hypothetical protein